MYMSSLNMEVFQSFLSTLEGEAQSWGQGQNGYEQIRELAEKTEMNMMIIEDTITP